MTFNLSWQDSKRLTFTDTGDISSKFNCTGCTEPKEMETLRMVNRLRFGRKLS
jgi:hypothetical protein